MSCITLDLSYLFGTGLELFLLLAETDLLLLLAGTVLLPGTGLERLLMPAETFPAGWD